VFRQIQEEYLMARNAVVAGFAGLLAWTGAPIAQNFPTRPVTMVIPFAAGGPTDVLGRVVGAKMGEVLGQQMMRSSRSLTARCLRPCIHRW
jgi:tripartite-type tricarboxylate transporter receptor subunit TctC